MYIETETITIMNQSKNNSTMMKENNNQPVYNSMMNKTFDAMTPFEIAEMLGRGKAMRVLADVDFGFDVTIKPTTDQYCRWDFEVFDKETDKIVAIVEVKDRNMNHNDNRIVSEGCHLDSSKYDALQRVARKKGIDAYFLATFKDNVGYIWDIMDTPTTEVEKMSNKTTCVASYKELKKFRLFKKDDVLVGIQLEEKNQKK